MERVPGVVGLLGGSHVVKGTQRDAVQKQTAPSATAQEANIPRYYRRDTVASTLHEIERSRRAQQLSGSGSTCTANTGTLTPGLRSRLRRFPENCGDRSLWSGLATVTRASASRAREATRRRRFRSARPGSGIASKFRTQAGLQGRNVANITQRRISC